MAIKGILSNNGNGKIKMESTFKLSATNLSLLCLDGAFGEEEKLNRIVRETQDSLTNNFNDVKKLLLERRYQSGYEDVFEDFKKIAEIFLLPGQHKVDKIYEILSSFLGSNPKNNAYECMTSYSQCVKSHYKYFEVRNKILKKNIKSKKDYSELGSALIKSYCDALELAGKYIECLNCFLDLEDEGTFSIKKNNEMKLFCKIKKFIEKNMYPEMMEGFDNKLRNAYVHGNLIIDCETLEFVLKNRDGSTNKISFYNMIQEKYNKVISFDSAFIYASKLMGVFFSNIDDFMKLIDLVEDKA